jgi:predicted transcriptional regulator
MSVTLSITPNFFSFDDVDRRRRALGLTVEQLCHQAGVSVRTWFRIRASPYRQHRQALGRLNEVLERTIVQPALSLLLVRSLMLAAATLSGVDPVKVIYQGFDQQKPMDRDWLVASHLRRVVMYVLCEGLHVPRKIVCQVCQCTRQNIAQAIELISDKMEEEPALERWFIC